MRNTISNHTRRASCGYTSNSINRDGNNDITVVPEQTGGGFLLRVEGQPGNLRAHYALERTVRTGVLHQDPKGVQLVERLVSDPTTCDALLRCVVWCRVVWCGVISTLLMIALVSNHHRMT